MSEEKITRTRKEDEEHKMEVEELKEVLWTVRQEIPGLFRDLSERDLVRLITGRRSEKLFKAKDESSV